LKGVPIRSFLAVFQAFADESFASCASINQSAEPPSEQAGQKVIRKRMTGPLKSRRLTESWNKPRRT
jgi:hypothetical protein